MHAAALGSKPIPLQPGCHPGATGAVVLRARSKQSSIPLRKLQQILWPSCPSTPSASFTGTTIFCKTLLCCLTSNSLGKAQKAPGPHSADFSRKQPHNHYLPFLPNDAPFNPLAPYLPNHQATGSTLNLIPFSHTVPLSEWPSLFIQLAEPYASVKFRRLLSIQAEAPLCSSAPLSLQTPLVNRCGRSTTSQPLCKAL